MDDPSGPHDHRVATCFVCGARVVVDPEQVEQVSEYTTVPCTECSALVPVGTTEAVSSADDDMPAPLVGARETRRSLLGRWRRT
jgi:hypothetical protein